MVQNFQMEFQSLSNIGGYAPTTPVTNRHTSPLPFVSHSFLRVLFLKSHGRMYFLVTFPPCLADGNPYSQVSATLEVRKQKQ